MFSRDLYLYIDLLSAQLECWTAGRPTRGAGPGCASIPSKLKVKLKVSNSISLLIALQKDINLIARASSAQAMPI